MKKLYLIHGWGGSPSSEGWFGWLIKECKKRNIEIEIPKMPNTDEPKIKEWVGKLKGVVETNNEIYFVGHSVGCQAILRYIETLNPNVKIKGIVLVAPWMHLDEQTIKEEGEEVEAIAKPWMETPIDWNKVKSHSDNFIAIFSDNDPYIPLSDADLFKQKLNAQTIIKHNEEHFNETQEIPELLKLFK